MSSAEKSAYINEGQLDVVPDFDDALDVSTPTLVELFSEVVLEESEVVEIDTPENIASAALIQSELVQEGEEVQFDLIQAQKELFDIPIGEPRKQGRLRQRLLRKQKEDGLEPMKLLDTQNQRIFLGVRTQEEIDAEKKRIKQNENLNKADKANNRRRTSGVVLENTRNSQSAKNNLIV